MTNNTPRLVVRRCLRRGQRPESGLVMLTVSFVDPDPQPTSWLSLAGWLLSAHPGRNALDDFVNPKLGGVDYVNTHVDAGKIHVGINDSAAPLKFIATLVVEKGKPPASPAP